MIVKADPERRRIYGVAATDELDTQGDIIPAAELEEACARAIRAGIAAKINHQGEAVGELIACWPATPEVMHALGFSSGDGRARLLVGLQFNEAVWPRVKAMFAAGGMLSIGGKGRREAV